MVGTFSTSIWTSIQTVASLALRSAPACHPGCGPGHQTTPLYTSTWCIILNAIWSAPPAAALWLSAKRLERGDVPLELPVAKRAKAAALPPHSKSHDG